jgi:WD40 repeat protein/serine/threonine protein kinase
LAAYLRQAAKGLDYMDITTTDKLIEDMRSHSLLTASQLAELDAMANRPTDPRELAKEILKRQWLTRYQLITVGQGRAKELILGPYVLLDRLGEGGMGEVFRARHQRLERIVALKVIRTDKLKATDAVTRFAREARAAAKLSHPNIVTLYEDGSEGDTYYFSMEFVRGVDLSRWVREKGPMPLLHACSFIRQAALGLQHAHERGMVHRDIKPSNLMLVAGANQVKVLDMGLARLESDAARAADEGSSPITVEGAVMGTPDFLAPEQAKDAHSADIRADIYSLGCSLFYLVTGKAPFAGGSLLEKLLKHQSDSPPTLQSLRPEVPDELEGVFEKMMAKKPAERYQTPAEVAAALGPFCRAGSFGAAKPTETMVKKRGPDKTVSGKSPAPDTASIVSAPTVVPDEAFGVELVFPPTTEPIVKVPRAPRRPSSKPFSKEWMAKWSWVFGAVAGIAAVATAVVIALAILSWLGGSRSQQQATDETPPPAPKVPQTLDALRADAIPSEEVFPWQPRDLVAVLGTHRWRHWGPIRALAFNPADPPGHELVSVGDDDVIRVSRALTGFVQLEVNTNTSNANAVREIAYSHDGKYFATIAGNKITLYFAATGREEPIAIQGTALAFLPDGGLAVATGASIDIRSRKDEWKSIKQLGPKAGPIVALAVSRQGNVLAALTRQVVDKAKKQATSEVRLWQLDSGQLKASIPLGPHQSQTLALNRDGTTAITAAIFPESGNWPVVFWDVAAKKEKGRALGNQARVSATALTRDEQTLATAAEDGTVRLFTLRDMREKAVFADHDGAATALAITPNDAVLATAGTDGAIRLYEMAVAKELETSRKAHLSWIKAAAVAPDRTLLATAGIDHAIKLWEAGVLKEKAVLTGHRQAVLSLSFSSDQNLLASGSLDKTVGFWDVKKETELPPPIHFGGAIPALAFAPSGRTLAVGSSSPFLKLLDAITRKELPTPTPGHTRTVLSVDFFRDGKKLVSGSEDGTVRVWDVAKGQELSNLPAHPVVASVAVSPKSKQFASAGSDGTIKVWDAALAKSFWTRHKQVGAALLMLSQTGPFGVPPKLYLAPPELPLIHLWRNNLTIGQGPSPYKALAYSPDGKWLAAGCSRGVTVYEAASGRSLVQWTLPGAVNQVAFDSAGKHLVTVNANGTVYILQPPR